MNKRISQPLACIGLIFIALVMDFRSVQPVKKPNIIFILADDMGYGDIGCYG
jgi:arylsulfatase